LFTNWIVDHTNRASTRVNERHAGSVKAPQFRRPWKGRPTNALGSR